MFQPSQFKNWSLIKRDSRDVVVSDLRIADGYWSRLAGLQFRAELPAGRSLILVKASSVHTFWMRFSLDIAFIGSDGAVLEVRRAVKPWRVVVGPHDTHAVLESTAGWVEVEAGDRLIAICASAGELYRRRKSMRFLAPVPAPGTDQGDSRHTESEQQHAKT